MNLETIKDFCVKLDVSNDLGTLPEIEAYYNDIELIDLLRIYISYNGLKDYRDEEPDSYKQHYSIDLISLLEILKLHYG